MACAQAGAAVVHLHARNEKGDLTTDEPVLVRMHALNPLEDALGIVDAAANANADAVKFQMFTPDELLPKGITIPTSGYTPKCQAFSLT